jgi:predicted RNase H-like nuclease (RuvC/YqgF family)
MVDHDRVLRNEDYFEQYRSKKASLSGLKDQLKTLEHEVSDKKNQISDLKRELESMRKIITAVIEQGADPTEVRLRGSEDLADDMWEESGIDMLADLSVSYDRSNILITSALDPKWTTLKI